MCRWAPPCHRPLWKQHSALSVGRGVGCPCRLPAQDYPKTVCRKVHPKFAHLLTKQKINRQTLLQIVGVEFFEEKLEQFIYLSFFIFCGVWSGGIPEWYFEWKPPWAPLLWGRTPQTLLQNHKTLVHRYRTRHSWWTEAIHTQQFWLIFTHLWALAVQL